jgi:hypothetical protein
MLKVVAMKKLLGWVLVIFLFIAISSHTTLKPHGMHTIEGTWELQSFYNFDGQNITDTIPTAEGYRQIKMYYNGKVMWARVDPRAPTGRFGYGTYRITDTELTEKIEFGDAAFMAALDTMRIFTFELQLKDETFSQITVDEDGNRTFSENYLRID